MRLLLIIFMIYQSLVRSNQYLTVIKLFRGYNKILHFGCNRYEVVYAAKSLWENGFSNAWIRNPQLFLKAALTLPAEHTVFLIDFQCLRSAELLLEAKKYHLYSSPFKWVLYKANLDSEAEMFLASLPFLVESDVNLIWDNQEKYAKIFKKHIMSSILEKHYFNLTPDEGFNLFRNEVLLRSRRQLEVTLNACIVITNNDSLNHLTDKRDKHIDSITKANYPVVVSLASIYNITLNWTVVSTWGYKDNHSDWSGMMGQLTKKEADIGGTALFFTTDRIDLIDYIAMISPTKSKFIFREPKLSYVSNVYTLPLDIKVWLSTALLMLIMALILFFAMKWEYMKNELGHSNQTELSGSLRDVIFITLGALCQQSAAALPHSTPGRIVTLCLFISLMFMYVSYSAIIVALLQTPSNSIKTLEDLLNSRIEVGVDDTVFNHFYFTTANESTRKAIYEKKVSPAGKPSNFLPIEEGIERMRQGLFAFHVETGVGYKLIGETFKEDEKCDLQEIQYLQVIDPWLAIQKNSSYKEHLKVGLRILQENGVQQRETGLIYTKKPSCDSKGSNFVSVGIVDCYAPAVILAAGLAASLVLFILEIYVQRIVSVYLTKENKILKFAIEK